MGYLEQVNHSQRARDTPLKVWFLAEKDGTVRAAHCDCMAELCEACSHVGAVLLLWSLVLELEIPPLAHKKKANGCSACSTNPAKPAESS